MENNNNKYKDIIFHHLNNGVEMSKIHLIPGIGISKSTVRLIAITNGYKPILRANKERKLQRNPFLEESEQKWYWLGYLAADGNISSTKGNISICSITDKEHLKTISNFIPEISFIETTNSRLMASTSSLEVKEWLNTVGITPNKSNTLEMKIPLNWNFVRGYFDGNGSVSQNVPKITTGSKFFLQQLIEFFKQEKLEFSWSIKEAGKIKDCFDIRLKGESRFLFYYYMYNNNKIFMPRKKEKYRSALKQFKVQNIGLIAGILPFIQQEISSQANEIV